MSKVMKIMKIILFLLLFIAVLGGIYSGINIHKNMQHVFRYEKEVDKAVKENHIADQKNLVFAIIYTESKGRSIDLMQSSESAYGEQHKIDSQSESIEIGVAFLAKAIKKAKAANCDIWTAVQAYNFGLDYIDFVKKNGKKNSVRLAERYSKEVLSPLLGNKEQKKYRYYRPQSVLYNGGYLYKNGGNMFYADLIKMNREFVKWLN